MLTDVVWQTGSPLRLDTRCSNCCKLWTAKTLLCSRNSASVMCTRIVQHRQTPCCGCAPTPTCCTRRRPHGPVGICMFGAQPATGVHCSASNLPARSRRASLCGNVSIALHHCKRRYRIRYIPHQTMCGPNRAKQPRAALCAMCWTGSLKQSVLVWYL